MSIRETKKLYDEDPYGTEFDAVILAVLGPDSQADSKSDSGSDSSQRAVLALDQTLFFPEEGGQTCDRGELTVLIPADPASQRFRTSNDPDLVEKMSEMEKGVQNHESDKTVLHFMVTDVQIHDGVIYHSVVWNPSSEPKNPQSSNDSVCPEMTDVSSRDHHGTGGSAENPLRLLPSGIRVHGTLDFHHRYSNMQNHSGEHIFSGIVHRRFGYDNVGFHLSDHEVTMDYNGKLTDAEAEYIEKEAHDWVRRNVRIDCRYPSPEELSAIDYRSKKEIDGPVRIVTIPGCDVCACCAPHVRSTAEVGLVKVLSRINYKGGTRLSILCGERAVNDYIAKQKELTRISRLLKVPPLETADAVLSLQKDRDALRVNINRRAEKELLDSVASLPEDQSSVVLFTDVENQNLIRRAVNQMTKTHSGFCGIFSARDSSVADGQKANQKTNRKTNRKDEQELSQVEKSSGERCSYSYIIGSGSKEKDCRTLQKELSDSLSARGGGSPEMIQGSLTGTSSEIQELFAEN